VASLAFGAPVAQASHNRLEVGLHVERNGDRTASREEILRMRTGGADVIRTTFDWELVARQPDSDFDWSNFDDILTWASEGEQPKLGLLPILIGSPPWVEQTSRSTHPPVTDADLERWRRFVAAAAERYGRDGTFWADHPELQYNPIVDWQVWNEPNLSVYWTGGRQDPKAYTRFLKLTGDAIKSVDPQAKIVLAGMPERDDASKSMDEFLPDLYDVRGFRRAFDVIAIHPFVPVRNRDELTRAVKRIHRIAKSNGDRRKPIYLTEVGASTRGPKTSFTTSESGQRKALVRFFAEARGAARKYRVRSVFWHKWRDTDDHPPQIPENHRWQTYTGLFTLGGRAKSAWGAFADIAGGTADKRKVR
jgi:polysaccharide biosynthesis protein PslG